MKAVTSTVTYAVPSWNFCNHDNLFDGDIPKMTCRFCQKSKDGSYLCLLYNQALSTEGRLINKRPECCRATVGLDQSIVEAAQPQIDPKTVIDAAITEYTKVLKQFMNQGYPLVLAEKLAKSHLTGRK